MISHVTRVKKCLKLARKRRGLISEGCVIERGAVSVAVRLVLPQSSSKGCYFYAICVIKTGCDIEVSLRQSIRPTTKLLEGCDAV